MRIFRHYDDVPDAYRGAVVAVGNFDGVHRGHRALIAEAETLAGERGAPLAVLAFEPHPQEFFHPDAESFRLTPFRAKARLLAETGIDTLYAIAFDASIAKRTAEDFVRDVLVDGLGVRTIIVGGDFRFGKGRTGDVGVLRELGTRYGFGVEIFTPIIAHDDQK